MTGYQPDAPNGRLWLDPALPDWLPDIALDGLRVGGTEYCIRFTRNGAETDFQVLRGPPDSVARRKLAPWQTD